MKVSDQGRKLTKWWLIYFHQCQSSTSAPGPLLLCSNKANIRPKTKKRATTTTINPSNLKTFAPQISQQLQSMSRPKMYFLIIPNDHLKTATNDLTSYEKWSKITVIIESRTCVCDNSYNYDPTLTRYLWFDNTIYTIAKRPATFS